MKRIVKKIKNLYRSKPLTPHITKVKRKGFSGKVISVDTQHEEYTVYELDTNHGIITLVERVRAKRPAKLSGQTLTVSSYEGPLYIESNLWYTVEEAYIITLPIFHLKRISPLYEYSLFEGPKYAEIKPLLLTAGEHKVSYVTPSDEVEGRESLICTDLKVTLDEGKIKMHLRNDTFIKEGILHIPEQDARRRLLTDNDYPYTITSKDVVLMADNPVGLNDYYHEAVG